MKTFIRNLITIILLTCLSFVANAQQEKQKNDLFGDTVITAVGGMSPAQTADILQKKEWLAKDHFYFDNVYGNVLGVRFVDRPGEKSEIFQGNYWGGRFFQSVLINGTCDVEFVAMNVNDHNAADYRFHVVQNDRKELVSWRAPNTFVASNNGKFKCAYLGKFKYTPGQYLKVEIYNVNNYGKFDALLIDWRKVQAARILGVIQYTDGKFPVLDGYMTRPLNEIGETTKPYETSDKKGKAEAHTRPFRNFIETTNKNDIRLRMGDSLKALMLLVRNINLAYSYKAVLKRTVDGKTDSIDFGQIQNGFFIDKEFWKAPGKYKVTFTPKLQKPGGTPIRLLRNLNTNIEFTVLPPLSQTYNLPLKTVAYIILIILTTGGFMFMMYRRNQQRKQVSQQRKLDREAKDKQIATLQLASVRSQLNPHFMFNALAGIQNLMNKNEIESANKYLSRFARLTRNILDDGNKELTSIEKETALLTDYLQMEQTRFGFNFSIDIDEQTIDQQTEIPAMLLQPFVENAVKHGVSALKDKGMIRVGIVKQDADLILTVQDNGKGFSSDQPEGMGFKLCRERIALLNGIYKKSPILLTQNLGSEGALIRIELRGWV